MTGFLIGTAVVVLLALLALSRDGHRRRLVQAWVGHRPGASLHSWFSPDDHAGCPVPAVVEALIGRKPLGYASAIRLRREDAGLWMAEHHTTPPGAKSCAWFTVCCRDFGDGGAAERAAAQWKQAEPRLAVAVAGTRAGFARPGLMNVKMLDQIDPPGQ